MHNRFIETTPKYMHCTDRLDFGHSIERKANALNCKYLNPNSQKFVRWQFFDLDRADAAIRFDDANVAVPNAIIENEENGHAHYAYALEVGVVRSAYGRAGPQNYLDAIRRGMTRRLGADPNFGHYLAKNPLHPQWRTTWLSTKTHSLNDISVWLDPEDMRPAHKSQKAEHEFAQEGRNCSLTSDLAKFALRVAWRFKDGAHTSQDYQRALHVEAFNLNEAFPEPLPFKEVQAIVRSVGKWAWSHSTAEKFAELQRWRAASRRRRALGIISGLESFDRMAAPELAGALGRSERTAYRYIAEIRTRPMSERKAEPWQALGISRRTYYRQKAVNFQKGACA